MTKLEMYRSVCDMRLKLAEIISEREIPANTALYAYLDMAFNSLGLAKFNIDFYS